MVLIRNLFLNAVRVFDYFLFLVTQAITCLKDTPKAFFLILNNFEFLALKKGKLC